MNKIKKFNYENIYHTDKLIASNEYFALIINKIFEVLKESYHNRTKTQENYFIVINDFEEWIKNYWNLERQENNKNKVLFDMSDEKEYIKAIIYYISGMTDNYAIKMYNKIIKF